MGKRVVYVDDLTGKEIGDGEGGPVRFSLNDEYFEVDLGADSLAKLEKALKPYMEVAVSVDAPRAEPPRTGRRVRSSAPPPGRGGSGMDKEQLQAARDWLRAKGHDVSDRGRIKAELLDLYHAEGGRK